MKRELISTLAGGLVVSCQAFDYEPFYGPDSMVKMALSAQWGGAAAIRASWPENIASIKEKVNLPIFGINKVMPVNYDKMKDVIITPTLQSARQIVDAGSDIIAVDCTLRQGRTAQDIINLLQLYRQHFDVLIMGEVSTLQEGYLVEKGGADIISTTVAGYTSYSRRLANPDYKLIDELVTQCHLPVNAEGRFHTPNEVVKAFQRGAWTVTVGSAITRPHFITKSFVDCIKKEMNKKFIKD